VIREQTMCFYIVLAVFWCHAPIGLCKVASSQTSLHTQIHGHDLKRLNGPNKVILVLLTVKKYCFIWWTEWI